MSRKRSSSKKTKLVAEQHRFVQFIVDDYLNLSRQGLTDKNIPELTRFLLDHPGVTILNLSLNNIGNQGLADFAERNLSIINANFSGNIISDSGVAVFAYKNHMIEHVNFSHNLISDKGILAFAQINKTCSSTQFSTVNLH